MPKERLDVLVWERGLAESREKARRLIRAGRVLVDDQLREKPGHRFDHASRVTVKESARYVGRGGLKLEAALETFALDVAHRVCLDVGASTGGFTDCLLQHGAASVYAVDVGRGQLHWRLRNDARVVVREKTNARYLRPADFDPAPAFACVDVSFISLTKVLPAVIQVLAVPADIVMLIKPQFEAAREEVQRGGVVKDEAVRQRVVDEVRKAVTSGAGLAWQGAVPSPVKGPAGNVEFLAWCRKTGAADRLRRGDG